MKNLGIVIDTGNISYTLVDEEKQKIIGSGVVRYPRGVAAKSGDEDISLATERTGFRSARRQLDRKRKRKIRLLAVLSAHGFCPELTEKALLDWRYRKVYPENPEFRRWLLTDVKEGRNPYADRVTCISRKLDFGDERDRFIFGRALYHICGRRGYLSNARSEARNNEAGEVNTGIRMVTEEMNRLGCRTLGEYLNRKMGTDERIRGIRTSRLLHYQAEFHKICDVQGISGELRKELYDAIFMFRPMKSQKRNVGKCVFERNRFRCQRSQPLFEEYRMLQFINSIRVKPEGFEEFHPLTNDQREAVMPLFYRHKEYFDFRDIMERLCGKPGKKGHVQMQFNYRPDASVPGCLTTATIIGLLGCPYEGWEDELVRRYRKTTDRNGEAKSTYDVCMEVWRVLDSFPSDESKVKWLVENIEGVSEKKAAAASGTALEEGYQKVSISFVRKALPWLRMGYRYDEAVFLVNVPRLLPDCTPEERDAAERAVIKAMCDYDAVPFSERNPEVTKADCVFEAIVANSCGRRVDRGRFIHPSMVDKFPKVKPLADGTCRLGSPMDGHLRNPMVMRSLTELRHLVNSYLASGEIGPDTVVRVCLTKEMNSKNRREGIRMWQNIRMKENRGYAAAITDFFREKYGQDVKPTEDMVLKYRLWEEQKHVCLYTGKDITMEDIYGPHANVDIEHTIPVSRGGDDSDMNKTLCDSVYNRETKGTSIPSELSNFGDIRKRIEEIGLNDKLDKLESSYYKGRRKGRSAVDPESKAKELRFAAKDRMELDYWKGKMFRLTTESVPRRLAFGDDTVGNTARAYAVEFLKSVFRDVEVVSRDTLDSFRRLWGFKSRSVCSQESSDYDVIDSSVVACVGVGAKAAWAAYWKIRDEHSWSAERRPFLVKPWNGFTEDVLRTGEDVIVRVSTIDRTFSGGRRKIRDSRGRIRRNARGAVIYQESDRLSFPLYKQTSYGVISCDGELRAVKRVPFSKLRPQDIDKIVDSGLRTALQGEIEGRGFAGALEHFRYNGKKLRHIRVFAFVTVAGLTPVKTHRDASELEHKRYVWQQSNENYAVAVYGDKGRLFRGYDVAAAIRNSAQVIPDTDPDTGERLRMTYRCGTKLILHEPGTAVDFSDKTYISEHLYVVNSFAMNGKKPAILFYKAKDRTKKLVQKQFDGFTALVEGVDFYMDRKGNIRAIQGSL